MHSVIPFKLYLFMTSYQHIYINLTFTKLRFSKYPSRDYKNQNVHFINSTSESSTE